MTTTAPTAFTPGDIHLRTGAMLITRRTFWTPTDNHEPHRSQASGTVEEWLRPDGGTTLIVRGMSGERDAFKANYLVDDGRTVTVWYVAGYRPDDDPDAIFLASFPVNFHADGTPRMRGDDARRQVDMSMWALGPRRTYHLKIRSDS